MRNTAFDWAYLLLNALGFTGGLMLFCSAFYMGWNEHYFTMILAMISGFTLMSISMDSIKKRSSE